MKVSVDSVQLEILDSDTPITKGQEAVLDLLCDVVTEGYFSISSHLLIKEFGFSSPLPLISRLNHLIERGRLRVVDSLTVS